MQKPYTIHNGNSLEVLKGLEENSIDSIVTDPPYELGFMGKKWDSTGIAYNVELWKECLRVLKPGGHLLAFSGSRTYHRMAVAIEDAGFEVRDQIMWVYGCLSEDTQIVTPFGNKSYTEIKPNDLVLCYDKETNEYSYKEVEDIYEYDIKDTAYRIQSDFTDQIVSRNHRCIVERNGREVFEFAENLSPKENIPFLENLSELQDGLSRSGEGLQGWEGHKIGMATITPIEYEGKIWCVKVPTGAFVAVRNGMAFVTGNSGFPKSHDISKAIDKMAGAEREILGRNPNTRECVNDIFEMKGSNKITAPATEEAKQWEGWGTQIKPAHEPICLARKPLIGTVAENVLEWGTGGINIGGCRVGNEDTRQKIGGKAFGIINDDGWKPDENRIGGSASGRFPANFIHDGSDEVVGLFPNAGSGNNTGAYNYNGREYNNKETSMFNGDKPIAPSNYNDSGSAARFFYCAKASKRDRDEGLDGFALGDPPASARRKPAEGRKNALGLPRANHHPTVKPTDLMQYLCRLITPPNGLIIDPFMGSGSTGKAAMYEGFRFIGIDLDPEYCKIAEARIEFALNKPNTKEEKKPKGVKSSKQTSSDNTDNSSSPLW